MNDKPMTEADMAAEATRWLKGELPTEKLVDAPDAVPRAKESVSISIRLPRLMVEILKEFARRSGMGYQVLMKRWLDERIQQERKRIRAEEERLRRERAQMETPQIIKLASPTLFSRAAAFDARAVEGVSETDGTKRAAN